MFVFFFTSIFDSELKLKIRAKKKIINLITLYAFESGNIAGFNDENNQYKKIEIIIDRGPKKHRNINKTYVIPTKLGIHLNTIAIKIIKLTKEDFLSVFFILRFFSLVHLFRHVLNTKKHV